MAIVAIALSFFVIILATSISAGFRKEIRDGLSKMAGDIQVFPSYSDRFALSFPVDLNEEWISGLKEITGVNDVIPVIYRPGIVKKGDLLQGVMFKALPCEDSVSLSVRIPRRLSVVLGLEKGDKMLTYFIGESVQARNFTVSEIYDPLVESDDQMVVFGSVPDFQRLNGWDENEVSDIEIILDDQYRSPEKMEQTALLAGEMSGMVSLSVTERYPMLFDWLTLIDANVLAILLLMIVVAAFNMISGLLILLFRSTSTIGTLKSLGMTDRGISRVFLRLSARVVAIGMLIGNVAALLFCIVQEMTHLIKLDPASYFVSFVPVSVDFPSIFISDAVAFAAILLLLLIPTVFISKVDPAQTMRSQ